MPSKFKRKLFKLLPFLKILIGLICLIGLIWLGINFRPKAPTFWWQVVFTNPLKTSQGTTNILLLGVAGTAYDGADLTDSMILLNFNRRLNKTFLISLPRDIWSPTMQAKINTAYHYGEEKRDGGGFLLAKAAVEEVTGLPVHYAVKIDMGGLKKVIDLLGGVEINIEKSFDDYEFPVPGKENDLCDNDPTFACRYTHLHFDKGAQILNGERALQYIRSRKAVGEEGSDFARNKRQQNLMLAIKNKLLSREIILNFRIISSLPKLLDEITETDLPASYFPYFAKQVGLMVFSKLQTVPLENWLYNPAVEDYGQWVLIPKTGDFGKIHQYLQKLQ